jgi:plasmid stabilization system protein ParE
MSRVVVRPAAKADIREASAYYEGERPGLGEAFIDEVASIFARARKLPNQFPEIAKGVRRGLLHRFPYAVYFLMSEHPRARVMVALAVLHQHRAPATWKRRVQTDKKKG